MASLQLKARWQSLHELPHRIHNLQHCKETMKWVHACLVLQQMLKSWKEPEFDVAEEPEPQLGPEQAVAAPELAANQIVANRRAQLAAHYRTRLQQQQQQQQQH